MTSDTPPPARLRRSEILPLLGWLFCSLFFFYAFVLRVAPAVMVEELMRDFQVGGAVLGSLSAIYFYAYAGIQIPVGVMLDRYGVRLTASIAAVVCAGGTLLFAMATDLNGAYIGRAMIGAGAAFSFVGAMFVAGHWFPARFSVLTGISQALGVAGGIAGQAPLGLAVEAYGWRTSTIFIAAAGLVLAAGLALTLRDKPRGASDDDDRPSLLKGLVFTMGRSRTWIAAGVGGSMTAAMLSFAGLWGVPFLITIRGLEKPEAAGILSIMFVGWAIGAPALGWLSDRFGRRKPLIVACSSLAAISMLGIVVFPTAPLWWLAVMLFLQGFGSSSIVLCFAVARQGCPAWAAGATIGIVNTFVVGSGAVLQPVMGWLLDLNWDGVMVDGARIYSESAYAVVMPILPATCALGLALSLALREEQA